MFLEINDMSTGSLVVEPLNMLSVDSVYIKQADSKYQLFYKLNNGLIRMEEFDTQAEADNRLDEVKEMSIGGGGGGSYVLPVASAAELGGIKVGNNLSIDADGVLSASAGGSGLDFYGPIPQTALAGSDTINVTKLPSGIYWVRDYTRYCAVDYPSSSQTIIFSNYSVRLRSYLLYIVADYNTASDGEVFAYAEGTALVSDNLTTQLATFTKNTAKTPKMELSHTDGTTAIVSGILQMTGAQTVTGKKTFNTLPESSVTPTTNNQLVNKKYVDDNAGGLPFTVVDAHYSSGDNEFIFESKPVGCYLVHNGSTGPSSDITYRTNMSFRGSTSTSSRVSVTAQWGIIYIIKPYNDVATDEIFGYALFANGQTDGTMEFKLQSIKRLSSGYYVSFDNMMITNNNSPIKKMIRLYDSSSTYNVDDLVLNTDGWFYRCTTAITTPESFDSNHWTNFDGYGIDKYIKELISAAGGSDIPLEKGSHSTSPGVQMISTSSAANTASGMHAVALGTLARATQREATATGYNTTASGSASFAAGDSTQAAGNYAFASGFNTIANERQFARGFYNISKNYSNTGVVDIVGNGTGNSARSNAYTLDKQGNGWFAKDVYVGSTSGTDKDAGSVKLLRENVIAPAYDAAVSYAVNQLVIYDGALYKCNTATSGETWTPAHWTQTTLADLLSTLNQ